MIITTDLIKSLNPCKRGLDNFLTQYGHYWQGTHREFTTLDNITYGDKRWVLDRIYKQKIGVMPDAHITLGNIFSALDNYDKQEAIKTKDVPMFQVGDKISAFGVEGVVVSTDYVSLGYPIRCNFENKYSVLFLADGKYASWHKEPSLKLIERPKKKIKKYKVLFKRLEYENPFQVSGEHYADKEDFESKTSGNQFIQLIKESEIEVEE